MADEVLAEELMRVAGGMVDCGDDMISSIVAEPLAKTLETYEGSNLTVRLAQAWFAHEAARLSA